MTPKAEKVSPDELKSKNQADTPLETEDSSGKRKRTNTERKRLNLDLTPAAYELLQELSDDSGKNMAEVLRTGLALYGIAQDEMKKGRYLGIVEDDRVVRQIVLP